ncbi:uncharacterized protein LOC130738485 isoform X1 [Lotus japonicus]|uniref:uncharacterized protein LOC130738485 isoform X1 n=1 Tax=Lotus japonicus TaxID=34305 RepID=UPI00258725F7|nr:uncharacterized protein LOC130738485 isoform X1 [Lotus japonicus]
MPSNSSHHQFLLHFSLLQPTTPHHSHSSPCQYSHHPSSTKPASTKGEREKKFFAVSCLIDSLTVATRRPRGSFVETLGLTEQACERDLHRETRTTRGSFVETLGLTEQACERDLHSETRTTRDKINSRHNGRNMHRSDCNVRNRDGRNRNRICHRNRNLKPWRRVQLIQN